MTHNNSATARYSLLGDDLQEVEAALLEIGVTNKVRNYKHMNGFAVKLTKQQESELRTLISPDEVQFFRDTFVTLPFEVAAVSAKPGGGGNPNGGQQTPWGIDAVNAPAAWATTRGAGVAVCVVDTGIDVDHPDLTDALIASQSYVAGAGVDDEDGHGTHVAGTIAAQDNSIGVVGVAPDAKLISARIFDRHGSGSHADIADAVRGCEVMRDQVDPSLELVVNMSFALAGAAIEREIVLAAIQELEVNGAVFAGAAGNWGHPCIAHPGRWPEVYGVTAVYDDLSLWERSAHGNEADCGPDTNPSFAAPGVNVLSTWKGGGTRSITGTSMASPHVAGVLALALAADSLGPVAVDLGYPVTHQGDGLIDALATVQNTTATPGITVTPSSGLETTEDGQTAEFKVELGTQPMDNVTINLALDATGVDEALLDKTDLVFTNANWDIPQTVTLTGQDDSDGDGDQPYQIELVPSSADPDYGILTSVFVSAVNLDNEVAPSIHVADLDETSTLASGGRWDAFVTIAVRDANGAPIEDATVSGSWSSGASGSSTCTTDTDGICVVAKEAIHKRFDSVMFTVTNVVHVMYVYDATANEDPDNDSDGNDITVLKP